MGLMIFTAARTVLFDSWCVLPVGGRVFLPVDANTDAAMRSNISRCVTYVWIRAAIHEAAQTMEG
jgi:aerobic-type carbon monoxide dehydrogenase small subunit (CoxS/CutS family)